MCKQNLEDKIHLLFYIFLFKNEGIKNLINGSLSVDSFSFYFFRYHRFFFSSLVMLSLALFVDGTVDVGLFISRFSGASMDFLIMVTSISLFVFSNLELLV